MKNKWEVLMVFLLSNLWKFAILKISVRKKAMQWNYNHEKKSNNTNKGRLFLKNKYFNTQFHKVFLLSRKNTEMQWKLDILRFHIFLPEIYFLYRYIRKYVVDAGIIEETS